MATLSDNYSLNNIYRKLDYSFNSFEGVKENFEAGELNGRWKKLGRPAVICGRWIRSPLHHSFLKKPDAMSHEDWPQV
jgi:hypothetical protein